MSKADATEVVERLRRAHRRADPVTLTSAEVGDLVRTLDASEREVERLRKFDPSQLVGSHSDRRRVTRLLRELAEVLDVPKRRKQVEPRFSEDPAVREYVTKRLKKLGLEP